MITNGKRILGSYVEVDKTNINAGTVKYNANVTTGTKEREQKIWLLELASCLPAGIQEAS